VTDLLKKSDLVSRAKALENLRDRQFKVYNPVDQQWVEQTGGRKFVAPKMAASECSAGAATEDARLAAALALTGVEGVASDERF
jgi:2-methylcitrate dehydratase PrpD